MIRKYGNITKCMTNKIEIDLSTVENENVKKFIESEMADCKKRKIRIELIKQTALYGHTVSGYFTDEPVPTLSVGIDKPFEEWLPIFVHESCHKDQFVENASVWEKQAIQGAYDALHVFDTWVAHICELKEHQLRPVLQQIIDIELDCEKRSLEKIKKFDLPIDHVEYIQKSNAYIFYYHVVASQREYSMRKSPYTNPDVWSKMPTTWDNNYYRISDELHEIYLKHCY